MKDVALKQAETTWQEEIAAIVSGGFGVSHVQIMEKNRKYIKTKVKNPIVYYIGIGSPTNSKVRTTNSVLFGIDVATPLAETDFGLLIGADKERFDLAGFIEGMKINLSYIIDPRTGESVAEKLTCRELSDNKFEAIFSYDGDIRKVIVYSGIDLMQKDFIPAEIENGYNVLAMDGAGFYTTEQTAPRILDLLVPGKGFILEGSDDNELYNPNFNRDEFKNGRVRNIWHYLWLSGNFSMEKIGVFESYAGNTNIWCVAKKETQVDSMIRQYLSIMFSL